MDDKKTYTPEEVAAAVLKKTYEMWGQSVLAKAVNTSHEVELGEEPNNDDAEAPEYLAEADIEDDYKEDEKRKKGKKASSEAGEAEAEEDGEDKHAEEPEHEEGMSAEEEKEHDAAENEADEKDEDKVEADEEDGGVSDKDDAEVADTDKVIEEAADDSDDKDKKKKKEFGKSEVETTDLKKSIGKLKKFMARRTLKKMEKADIYDFDSGKQVCSHDEINALKAPAAPKSKAKKPARAKKPSAKAMAGKKAKKMAKNKAVEKILGMKGCK